MLQGASCTQRAQILNLSCISAVPKALAQQRCSLSLALYIAYINRQQLYRDSPSVFCNLWEHRSWCDHPL